MNDIHTIERGHSSELLDQMKAAEVGETLHKHYPGYWWMVSFQGGVLVVKIMGINMMTTKLEGAGADPFKWKDYGFVIKHQDSFSASDLAKQAVLAGGELLERAGLVRGKWDGHFVHAS